MGMGGGGGDRCKLKFGSISNRDYPAKVDNGELSVRSEQLQFSNTHHYHHHTPTFRGCRPQRAHNQRKTKVTRRVHRNAHEQIN